MRGIAAMGAVLVSSACGGSTQSSIRPALDPASDTARAALAPEWAMEQLRRAAVDLHRAFSYDGSEGLLRLRLHRDEVRALFNDDGIRRVGAVQTGLMPASGEQRWLMFRQFAESPMAGFCARGVRLAEPNGPEGLKYRALVVDRLLIVGAEPAGLWGAWVEGLVLTTEGWRLLPNIPFDRQIETPRRDHADVQLWDCDVAHRPQQGVAL